MSPATTTDRAAALRAAVRRVAGERGLHGATMSQIARSAGVAAGTAYVHYADKDDLVLAAYVEAKQALTAAVVGGAAASGTSTDLRATFVAMWLAAFHHMRAHRTDALFVLQVDVSPYAREGHARLAEHGEDLAEHLATTGMGERLRALPDEVLYELGLAPAVRLAAREAALTDDELRTVATACWDAVADGVERSAGPPA